MFRPFSMPLCVGLLTTFFLTSAATVSAEQDDAAEEVNSTGKNVKELAGGVEAFFAADLGDTDVRIAENRKKAFEKLAKTFDGRRIKLVFPIKNISGGERGSYMLSLEAPGFPVLPRWYIQFLSIVLTREQALKVDRSSALEISGSIKLLTSPVRALSSEGWGMPNQAVDGQSFAAGKSVAVVSWDRSQGEPEFRTVSLAIEKATVAIVTNGREILRLEKNAADAELQTEAKAIAEIEKLGGSVNSRKCAAYASFARTQVTDAGLANLEGLTELQSLDLRDTEVTDAGLEHLKGLTKLWSLDLRNTRVTGEGLEDLKGLPQLRELYLSDTQVTDAGLEHLKGLNTIQSLYLIHTQITDAGLEHLKELRNIQWLYLRHTRVTSTGVKNLQRALPEAHIYR
jgi:Leucine-rich repeat (LRR) protein